MFYGREVTGPEAEDFTVIVLPDTQHYSELYPEIFTAQTQWIVDKTDELNIAYMAHVGDCVQFPTETLEWTRADDSISLLDPPEDTERLPFGIASIALIPRPFTGCRKVSILSEAKSGQNFDGGEVNKVVPSPFAAPTKTFE